MLLKCFAPKQFVYDICSDSLLNSTNGQYIYIESEVWAFILICAVRYNIKILNWALKMNT
jgi:hypothetical protein